MQLLASEVSTAYYYIVVRTDRSGKEALRQVGAGRGVTSGRLTGRGGRICRARILREENCGFEPMDESSQ